VSTIVSSQLAIARRSEALRPRMASLEQALVSKQRLRRFGHREASTFEC